MANPPFAGDIKESRIIAQYELGSKVNKSGKRNYRQIFQEMFYSLREISIC